MTHLQSVPRLGSPCLISMNTFTASLYMPCLHSARMSELQVTELGLQCSHRRREEEEFGMETRAGGRGIDAAT